MEYGSAAKTRNPGPIFTSRFDWRASPGVPFTPRANAMILAFLPAPAAAATFRRRRNDPLHPEIHGHAPVALVVVDDDAIKCRGARNLAAEARHHLARIRVRGPREYRIADVEGLLQRRHQIGLRGLRRRANILALSANSRTLAS